MYSETNVDVEKFQTLIGILQTVHYDGYEYNYSVFQTLIGILQTFKNFRGDLKWS